MTLIRQPTPDALRDAAAALADGQLIGLPTETVYGLAADATNAEAVARVFEAKGRPRFNPLISHIASAAAAEALGIFSPLAVRLAEAFWPGPLTLVVPRQPDCPVADLVTCGLDTLALRVPAHPVARAVLEALGRPVAAPSANRSGRPSPTTAAHVDSELGPSLALILDGGPCDIGLESTVVAVTGDRATLLRSGGIERAALEAITGPLMVPTGTDDTAPASPGMLTRHYAPDTPLILNVPAAGEGAVHIGFGPPVPGEAFNLSPSGDLREAATSLFATLRAADAVGGKAITVAPVPDTGLGEAINDRLRRGASAQRGGA